jgi:hypothetical protein
MNKMNNILTKEIVIPWNISDSPCIRGAKYLSVPAE